MTMKQLENLTENDLKEMFIDIFFWIADHRPEWLQEAINRRKRELGRKLNNDGH